MIPLPFCYATSLNEGNHVHFPEGVKAYIRHCQKDGPASGRPYTSRCIGSLVSDFHRNLLKGGIFIYPPTGAAPKGKLRLVYECNPIAMVAEQAGGRATDGYSRILERRPTDLHERVPFFVGSREMVREAEGFPADTQAG